MKLKRALIENVRSFLDPAELIIDGNISIIIGPNGGGKTNLLDTVSLALRLFLLKSWLPRHNPTAEWQERYDWVPNESIRPNLLEKHSQGAKLQQRIEIDLQITQQDLENIQRIKKESSDLVEKSRGRYTSFPIEAASSWNIENLASGQIFKYVIINTSLQAPTSTEAGVFQQYLNTYEVGSRLRSELELTSLSTPMISLPVNRSGGGLQVSISLANFNEHELKQSVDAASSRASGSIVSLAIGRLASRYRHLLENANGKAKEAFDSDPQIKMFTSTLRSLGYEWKLECVNVHKNQYDIRLSKQGSSFLVGSASSGEKELLIYLFAIYALNIRDALIVIDEPELHLHPRWQRTLLDLFEKLATDTGNQFLMATHSPVFVSPTSIQYVSRVFSESQRSKIVRLTDSDLPDAKHLLNIVNSQNNERLFFADKVILVEGISDRIFFEALFRSLGVGRDAGLIFEIVSVGGKGMFDQYKKLLLACKVPFSIIADLDYVNQVGSESIMRLFGVDSRAVHDKVVSDQTSIDARSLITVMDEAIRTRNTEDLSVLWEYIKGRQRTLRDDLDPAEKNSLFDFIREMRSYQVHILIKGALEAYLPTGYKSKDMEKLIQLVSDQTFLERLPEDGVLELKEIVRSIHS